MNIQKKDVLELGPGRSCELLTAFVLAGGRSGLGLDVSLEVPRDCVTSRLRELRDLLRSEAGTFLDSVGSAPQVVEARYEALAALEEVPVEFRQYGGRRLPLADDSVDVLVSRSVLEHVSRNFVAPLLTDMRRVLRAGGAMVHVIDLRDHMQLVSKSTPCGPSFSDVAGDWLDALTYPDWLFDAMFARRPVSINRLRVDQWLELFHEAGFRVVHRTDQVLDLPSSARQGRLRQPWRAAAPEILRVAQTTLALT